jgi:hypothetical protein
MREITERALYEMFDDFLDAVNPDFEFGSLSYPASEVIKMVDRVCYDLEFSYWLDAAMAHGFIHEHADGCYYDEPEDDEE